MLIVLDRNEKQLGYLTKAKNVELRERLNGESLLSFEIPFDGDEYTLLQLEGYVKLNGQLYVIKSIDESSDGRMYATVQCVHVYIELVDEYIDRIVELFGVTAQQALSQALQGTQFTGTVTSSVTGLRDIDISEMNVLKAVQLIREKWDCDLWFENRTVFLGTRGINAGTEIRYGKNMKALKKPSSSQNVITRLYVYGKDGLTIESVNGGKKYIDSPNIGLYRRPKCADVRFNDIDDPNELLAEGQRYLQKHDTIDVSYQIDFVDENEFGIGDTVTITHIPFNIQTVGTRVVERVTYPLEKHRLGNATLSSFVESTIDDYVKLKRQQNDFERYSTERYVTFEESRQRVQNGEIFVVDKYGQVIVNQEGVDVQNIAGFGIESGGIISVQNKVQDRLEVTISQSATDVDVTRTIYVGDTSLLPSSNQTNDLFLIEYTEEKPAIAFNNEQYAGPLSVKWTGKTATSLTGVTIELGAKNVYQGNLIYKWIRPVGDIVVSPMTVVMPNKKRFVITETRFAQQTLGTSRSDQDGWEFRILYIDSNGQVKLESAGTQGGLRQYPPNPPAGSVRIGYMLIGDGLTLPDGTINSGRDRDSRSRPIFKELIYHDFRYRDERLIRTSDRDILIGGVPYGTQTLAVSVAAKEYKTYYIPVGKGRRSTNLSITIDDGSGYDNFLYGANLTVGRKAANDADGKGRPIFGSYTDADGQRGHVTGLRNIAPYGIHVLSPRVWNKQYTMLYDIDLMPDPNDPSVISLKLTFYNYSSSVSESFNLKLNWHAL